MSSATPEPHGFFASPVRLFVLSTAMAATAATAAAFMLFGAQQDDAPTPCTCVCEAPQTPAEVEAPPIHEETPAEAAAEPETDPVSEPEVDGALDRDLLRRIVRAHISEVRYCYNQGLSDGSRLAGRVDVQFTIGPSGDVSASSIASSTLDHDATEVCIAKAVKRWKFPKPEAGDAVVTYPFVLRPDSRG